MTDLMPYHLSSFLAWSLAIQQRRLIAVAAIFMVAGGDAGAAELSLKTVVETLVAARPGNAPDFSGRDLSLLDLSDLDFKRAPMERSNLPGANLAFADLSWAKLDRSQLSGTDFSNAWLTGASFYDALSSIAFEPSNKNAPNFSGADLPGARIPAHFSRGNFRGSKLVGPWDSRLTNRRTLGSGA